VDLVRVFQQVLERRKEVTRIELRRDEFTVGQMMKALRAQLSASDDGIELVAFFESCASRSAMICALLAVLELVRLQAILLAQGEIFGSIALRKHKMFDVVFGQGGEGGTIDEQYR
jgi:segregation and condensation protein A